MRRSGGLLSKILLSVFLIVIYFVGIGLSAVFYSFFKKKKIADTYWEDHKESDYRYDSAY